MPSLLRYTLVGLSVFVLQWLVVGRLRLWGAYADVVLLFVAWLGLRHGRRAGSAAGFALGLLMDAAYQTWGIHMFIKTLVGFLVGLFPANERETLLILPQQAFIGSLVISLLHNGLLVTFLVLETGTRDLTQVLTLWIGASVYTAFLGTLAALFGMR